MPLLLNLLQGSFFLGNLNFPVCPSNSLSLLQPTSRLYNGKYTSFQKHRFLRFPLQGSWDVVDHPEIHPLSYKVKFRDGVELDSFPHAQTLRNFPKEELFRKVALVRFDSSILIQETQDQQSLSVATALSTIKYLYEAGAKVVLASNWSIKINSKYIATESVAEYLSVALQCKVVPVKFVSRHMRCKMKDEEKSNILLFENLSEFKEELANCSKFAEQLSLGVDIFVNDVFSQSHRILASTVGVACFCYACVAGFHFEEGLNQLKKIVEANKKPYIAIIGGGDLLHKAAALRFLASRLAAY